MCEKIREETSAFNSLPKYLCESNDCQFLTDLCYLKTNKQKNKTREINLLLTLNKLS